MSNLILSDVKVSINEQGLYRLNDLHKAAGGETKHKPSEWLRNQQTESLIDEINKAGIPALESVQKRGTYACKELVYAYAMWISPSFHLKVIRAFDALASGDIEKAVKETGSKVAKAALDDMRKSKAIALQIQNAKALIEFLPHLGESAKQTIAATLVNPVAGAIVVPLPRIEEKFYTTTELAGEFGVSSQKLGRIANKYLAKTPENGEYRLSQSQHSSKQVEQFYWNEKGKRVLHELVMMMAGAESE